MIPEKNNFCVEFIKESMYKKALMSKCTYGGTGRRCRLKICWEQSRASSILARCTIY